MKIEFMFNWQIGVMLSFGVNHCKRKYITVEFPLVIIQVFWWKPKENIVIKSKFK